MATKKTKQKPVSEYPIVVKGSHLTVTTYEDGSTKLEWDDEALLNDVQNAIIKHGTPESVAKVKSAVKAKSNRKTKVQSQ